MRKRLRAGVLKNRSRSSTRVPASASAFMRATCAGSSAAAIAITVAARGGWSATDWEFGFGSAELHARLSEGKGSFTELRQREALMGMTADARYSLRIRYVKPSAASKAEEAPAPKDNVVTVDFGEMYGDAS